MQILSSTPVHLLSQHLPPLLTEPTRSAPISQRALILLSQPWHPFFRQNRSPAKSPIPAASPVSSLTNAPANATVSGPANVAPANAPGQRRASTAHLLSAAVAPLPATPFRRSYFASRRNTSTRLTASRAHLRLFLLNTSTRLPPFLCFSLQLLPATSVSLSPTASHTYSQPASLFIAGCFLFFSSPNNRIAVLSTKQSILFSIFSIRTSSHSPRSGRCASNTKQRLPS
ncbi:hypothetical protein BHM03_00029381 [Ensete ventricosum]|uniref:Uncharacterized protein n=1 Tax=Ensete ventricosum TaxID=4639 RepID=A0A445MI64_ENSVE|nr:hypothetical protein BHM03_00029381 [Ensete ventricosum]